MTRMSWGSAQCTSSITRIAPSSPATAARYRGQALSTAASSARVSAKSSVSAGTARLAVTASALLSFARSGPPAGKSLWR